MIFGLSLSFAASVVIIFAIAWLSCYVLRQTVEPIQVLKSSAASKGAYVLVAFPVLMRDGEGHSVMVSPITIIATIAAFLVLTTLMVRLARLNLNVAAFVSFISLGVTSVLSYYNFPYS